MRMRETHAERPDSLSSVVWQSKGPCQPSCEKGCTTGVQATHYRSGRASVEVAREGRGLA